MTIMEGSWADNSDVVASPAAATAGYPKSRLSLVKRCALMTAPPSFQ